MFNSLCLTTMNQSVSQLINKGMSFCKRRSNFQNITKFLNYFNELKQYAVIVGIL